jgi:hypothetical protein
MVQMRRDKLGSGNAILLERPLAVQVWTIRLELADSKSAAAHHLAIRNISDAIWLKALPMSEDCAANTNRPAA